MTQKMTKVNLAKTCEKYMDSVAGQLSDAKSNISRMHIEEQLQGMQNLTRELGVRCDCFYSQFAKIPRDMCKCRPYTKSELQYLKIGS